MRILSLAAAAMLLAVGACSSDTSPTPPDSTPTATPSGPDDLEEVELSTVLELPRREGSYEQEFTLPDGVTALSIAAVCEPKGYVGDEQTVTFSVETRDGGGSVQALTAECPTLGPISSLGGVSDRIPRNVVLTVTVPDNDTVVTSGTISAG